MNLLPSNRIRNPDLIRELTGEGAAPEAPPKIAQEPKKTRPERKRGGMAPPTPAVKNRRPVTSEESQSVKPSRLAIYLTPEEHWALRDAAHAARVTLQDYCRAKLLDDGGA